MSSPTNNRRLQGGSHSLMSCAPPTPLRYIYEDVDRQWSYHDKNNDKLINWQEYKDGAFGNIDSELSDS